MLEHTHLCIDQYLSVITFRRDVLQVGYSPLSLYYYYTLVCHDCDPVKLYYIVLFWD